MPSCNEKNDATPRSAQPASNDQAPLRTHPDSHLLDDWGVYGPKNIEIERLVRELALDHGMRVKKIEEIIVAALRKKMETMDREDQ